MTLHEPATSSPPAQGALAKNAIGMWHLVFFVVAAAAPLTALATNSPIAISFGGVGAAGAFIGAWCCRCSRSASPR